MTALERHNKIILKLINQYRDEQQFHLSANHDNYTLNSQTVTCERALECVKKRQRNMDNIYYELMRLLTPDTKEERDSVELEIIEDRECPMWLSP
jgi:hypothetical protein